jgi:Flp pilus assembly protein TadD
MSKGSAKRQTRATRARPAHGPAIGRKAILIAAILAVFVFAVFARTVRNGFIYFDDDYYVTQNSIVQKGLTMDGLAWALTTTDYFYYPVTWLSHMMDCELYGLHAGGHHFTSTTTHALTAVLVFAALFSMTGALWRSALVAGLFAIHPLRVESVAWVAERKDLLAGFFWFGSILAYSFYVRRPSWKRYALVAAAFAIGLMTKTSIVTLPFVLLLLDYWPLGRFLATSPAILVREKALLVPFSAASSILTYVGQKRMGAMTALAHVVFRTRLENATVSYAKYLSKTFWPHPLAVPYPYDARIAVTAVLGAAALLVAITVVVILERSRAPFLLVGWFWFLGVLVPMIGLVQIGAQSMADRYTYIPCVGLFIMLVWGGWRLLENRAFGREVAAALAVLSISALATAAWLEIGFWKDSVTLFRHAVEVTTDNFVAEHNLAFSLASDGRLEEAVPHYRESLHLEPRNAVGYYNLGLALAGLRRPEDAASCFANAARQSPRYAEAHYSLGAILLQLNQPVQAREELQAALKLSLTTEYASQAHFRLGMIAAIGGEFGKARDELTEALRLNPAFPEARDNLARVTAQLAAR